MGELNVNSVLFWILSLIVVGCALGVVFSRNPIKSVMFLIATFFGISGHYILMNAQFLAIVNIIVYAGAIMVLFLYILKMLNLNKEDESKKQNINKKKTCSRIWQFQFSNCSKSHKSLLEIIFGCFVFKQLYAVLKISSFMKHQE